MCKAARKQGEEASKHACSQEAAAGRRHSITTICKQSTAPALLEACLDVGNIRMLSTRTAAESSHGTMQGSGAYRTAHAVAAHPRLKGVSVRGLFTTNGKAHPTWTVDIRVTGAWSLLNSDRVFRSAVSSEGRWKHALMTATASTDAPARTLPSAAGTAAPSIGPYGISPTNAARAAATTAVKASLKRIADSTSLCEPATSKKRVCDSPCAAGSVCTV